MSDTGRLVRARVAIAPVSLALVDMGLTLAGQPSDYWGGDYAAVLEANPLARLLLEIHPGLFAAASVAYLAAIALAVFRLPPRGARCLALVFTLTHAFGGSTWLLRFPGGIFYCVGLWGLARLLVGAAPTASPVPDAVDSTAD
jgi:hypothetical protein